MNTNNTNTPLEDSTVEEKPAQDTHYNSFAGVSKKKKIPNIWDFLAYVLIFFIGNIFVTLLLSCFGISVVESEPTTVDIERYMESQILRGERLAIIYPLSMIFSIILLRLYAFLRGARTRLVRFSRAGWNPNIILMAMFWIVATQIVVEPIVELLPKIDYGGVGQGFWACVTAVFFAPILEEFMCRGVVLETVRRKWGGAVAVVVSSLFFGVIHVEPATAVSAVVVGGILGFVYLRTKSLFSTILLHGVNNALAFAFISIGFKDITFSEMLGGGWIYWTIYGVAMLLFLLCSIEALHYFRRLRRLNA